MTSHPPTCIENLILLVAIATSFYGMSDSVEYCDKENFEANCANDKVIIMQSAKYGRMNVGRCINGEGQMNCEHDVTNMLHALCSGRKTCEFEVSDIGKERAPCKKDYASYLDATYKCQDLTLGDPSQCSRSQEIRLTAPTGLLPSLAHSTNVGVQRCPWTIQAKQGQQIQLNISVFNTSSSKSDDGSRCQYSVMLKGLESHTWHRKDVCGYTWGQAHVYTSDKNTLQVFNAAATLSNNPPTYVLKYRVIGCADVVAPSFSSVIRTGNDLVVKCNRTKETWFLTCRGSQWMGEMGNCTPPSSPVADSYSAGIPYTQGLIAAVILGLVLGILIGFTSLGIYVIHRRRKLQRGVPYHQDPASLQYEAGAKEPQYGEVPLYRDSGSSSTYYATDSGITPSYGGTSLKRATHICEQVPTPPLQDPMGGGAGVGAIGVRGGLKMTLHTDPQPQQQQQPTFTHSAARRDLL